jgi:hypothetical protein
MTRSVYMSLRPSILKVSAYFDVFDYPLTAEEIGFFMDREIPIAELKTALDTLTKEHHLFRTGRFYALRDIPGLSERRINGNIHAAELLGIARKISRLLYQFPYVRGIGVSGSLSKNYADDDSDIDYFVITRTNRLWIARTFMHFYKKWSFLTGRQHWYCMNYYVDEEALEIEEKNIFTAIELITLLPVCGNGGLVQFFDANNWATDLLPNYRHRIRTTEDTGKSSRFKKLFEWLFNHRIGDWLDDLLRDLTTRRWQKKEARGIRNAKGFTMSLKTGKHYSRPNPAMLQKKILDLYSAKFTEFSTSWQLEQVP